MSKKVKDERTSWIKIPESPAPGQYDPKYLDTRLPQSLKGKHDSINDETVGPGPARYDVRLDNSIKGSKWHPAHQSKQSSRRNSYSKSTPTNVAVVHPTASSSAPDGRVPRSPWSTSTSAFPHQTNNGNEDFIPTMPIQQPHVFHPSISTNTTTTMSNYNSNPIGDDRKPKIIVTPAWPDPSRFPVDYDHVSLGSTIEGPVIDHDTHSLSSDDFVGDYASGNANVERKTDGNLNAVKIHSTPTLDNGISTGTGHTEETPTRRSIFLTVPPNKSPFVWLTDGKLSILGFICAVCAIILGIVHIGLWNSKGLCIFSGIWLMVWGLLIAIIEGMRIPKITIFNHLEILYPLTRLVNNWPYFVKTTLYAGIGIIAIAVCAKWTSGVGGGMLIILGFGYALKQIDQNYLNRQLEFERIRRRPDSHVPVWAIT